MLSVIHKKTGEIRNVYGVNGLSFLFWDDTEESWVFDGIENYKPIPDFAEALKQFGKACGVNMEDKK